MRGIPPVVARLWNHVEVTRELLELGHVALMRPLSDNGLARRRALIAQVVAYNLSQQGNERDG